MKETDLSNDMWSESGWWVGVSEWVRERERKQVPFLRTYYQGRCFYERFAFSSCYHHNWSLLFTFSLLLALLAAKARRILCFGFIIEYSSLRDFGPY
jgi:hypothetical protein